MFEVLGRMSSAGMGAQRWDGRMERGSSGMMTESVWSLRKRARTVPSAPQNHNRRARMYAARADRRAAARRNYTPSSYALPLVRTVAFARLILIDVTALGLRRRVVRCRSQKDRFTLAKVGALARAFWPLTSKQPQNGSGKPLERFSACLASNTRREGRGNLLALRAAEHDRGEET